MIASAGTVTTKNLLPSMSMAGRHRTFIGHMAALLISIHSHWSPGPRLLAEGLGRTVQEEEHDGHNIVNGVTEEPQKMPRHRQVQHLNLDIDDS
ncbi:hypothetical protein HZ326_10335 [Fusarium oxysporum f. sp. albedinis]|nr:hypothetical protein HZ326_10335 [Fusarium oxysporum f. sp. albedinis]